MSLSDFLTLRSNRILDVGSWTKVYLLEVIISATFLIQAENCVFNTNVLLLVLRIRQNCACILITMFCEIYICEKKTKVHRD